MSRANERYRVWRHTQGSAPVEASDDVANEGPLEVRVAGRGVSVTMRTPGHDEELALGFLVGEGVVRSRGDVEHVRRCGLGEGAKGDVIDVLVRPETAVDFARLTRHVFASSSCGVCGSATIEAVRGVFAGVGGAVAGPSVAAGALWEMLAALQASQPTFDKTGGLHAAGLFEIGGDGRATLVAAREDVGRHNAVDKVVGFAFKAGMLPLSRHALLVSGRVSFEIVQKALAAGVPVVAAVSAPSSLAIDLAEESGVTLIGFLRGGEAERAGRFNVYSHPGRVRG